MSKKKFEQALARLEQIVAELEEGNLALDTSLKKFNEGIQLASFCSQKLDEARSHVDLLQHQKDGSLAAEPFQAAQQESLNAA
jgi:exodeoxyribonuclease VII small subunit